MSAERRTPERNIPEGYMRALQDMAKALKAWFVVHPHKQPRFVLGPKYAVIIAPLDAARSVFCKNDDAIELSHVLDAAARSHSGDGCTVFMLDVLLQMVGMPVGRMTLDELPPQFQIMGRGGQA